MLSLELVSPTSQRKLAVCMFCLLLRKEKELAVEEKKMRQIGQRGRRKNKRNLQLAELANGKQLSFNRMNYRTVNHMT